jgi:hypothetical protein
LVVVRNARTAFGLAVVVAAAAVAVAVMVGELVVVKNVVKEHVEWNSNEQPKSRRSAAFMMVQVVTLDYA